MAENKTKKIKQPNPLIGAQAVPTTLDKKVPIDIDTTKALPDYIIDAGLSGNLDTAQLENFTTISNARDQIYQVIDTMAMDSSVSSIIRTYAEEVCEPADSGHIVWCESSDPNISKFINYLLNTMNVDKSIFGWVYSLIKYGDVYLKLYRESDYKDNLFNRDKIDMADTAKSQLNESVPLEERVNLNVHTANDNYSYYIEMVTDPGTMFELTKYGKTFGYVEVPIDETNINYLLNYQTPGQQQQYSNYRMRSNDVNIYQADDFVHACLQDNLDRYPEKVQLFLTQQDYEAGINAATYTVRRGKSMLYDSYKIWREKSLLETSALLNRITKSSVVRNVQVEVGDMPKNQVTNTLRKVKTLFEQKSAIDTGAGMTNYNNPGPVENNIYTATYNGKGAITVNSVGGDIEVKNLADLDWWNNKFYSSYGVPKQYFGWCLKFDTPILLLDGSTHTIEELYANKDAYIGKGILGCNADGSLCPTRISNIILTNPRATYMRIWLDNGKYVDVTPDHKMMLRDGTFVEARDLTEGTSLMPYYDRIKDGRRYVLDNSLGKFVPLYHVVAAAAGMSDEEKQARRELSRKNGKANVAAMQAARMQKMAAEKPETIRKPRKLRCPVCGEIFELNLNDLEYNKYLKTEHLYFCCKEHRDKLDVGGKLARSYQLYLNSDCDEATYESNRMYSSSRPDTFLKFTTLEPKLAILNAYVPEVNHKVTKIEYFDEEVPVYDITVADDCHTFALPCGIFVHNCEDGAGFNGGTSLSILSSVFAKGVKRVQNSILQALTDAVSLICLNRGCRSYLNNFVLKMRAPLTQEEIDYRSDLTNRIGAISNIQSLLSDVESRARKLTILRELIKTLDYGDDIINELQKEIDAAEQQAKEEAEAAAAEAAEGAEAEDSTEAAPAADLGGEDMDLGNSSMAEIENFGQKDLDKETLVEGSSDLIENDELPTPEELNSNIDFTENT